jgi:hypothetical protein
MSTLTREQLAAETPQQTAARIIDERKPVRTATPDFRKIAADLIQRGFKITPLEGKAPFLHDWPNTASSDPVVIAQWAAKYPTHNIGIVTSEKSWSVDVDHVSWFMDNTTHLTPLETLKVETGSGKYHFHFKGPRPAGLKQVKNPAHVSKEETPNEPAKLLEYPDQVVAPYSIHPETGKPYKICRDYPLAECPPDWLQWLRSLNDKKQSKVTNATKYLIRKDWNPEVELKKAGLDYSLRKEGEETYLDYHVKMGKCLVKGGPHHSNGQVDGKRQSCFVIKQLENGWDLAHQCFSCGPNTKQALAALGIDLKDIIVKEGLSYELRSLGKRTKKHLSWLWPDYLPTNKLVHFGGASTAGKSPVTLDLIARVTAGLPWPDGTPNTLGPRSVILLAAEDDLDDTVLPRLELAGADVNKVFELAITARTGDSETEINAALDRDYGKLVERAATLDDLALIVVDPITNYLGSKKMNSEEEMRGSILMPLSAFAQNKDVCVITVGHFNKNREATIQQRIMGAAAFYGVARFVFVFGDDPEDDDKYAHVMAENRNKAVAMRYKTVAELVEWDGKQSKVVKVEWRGTSHADQDEVVNAPKQREKNANKEVQEFVKVLLREGAKPTKVIEGLLNDAGIRCENWQRAARKVAKSRQIKGQGKGAGWEWYLPTLEQTEFDTRSL